MDSSPAVRRLSTLSGHLLEAGLQLHLAALPVAGCRASPVIKNVVAQILRLPTVDGAKGDSGQDTLIVRVVTECGLVGIGEVEAQPEVRCPVAAIGTIVCSDTFDYSM